MKRTVGRYHSTGLAACVLVGLAGLEVSAAEVGALRAGAARVDITPREGTPIRMSGYGGRTDPFEGIHDRLYARAVVVDDGEQQAAIVIGDLIGIGNELWQTVTQRIADDVRIPPMNVLLAGTHTHGGPNLRRSDAATDAYAAELVDRIVDAVRQAKQRLRPARVGVGRGTCGINMNRRARTTIKGMRWLGKNPDGPSDKTVHVVKFETLDAVPIAILVNYGVHGTVMGPRNRQITADVPGACSRFVEKHFGDNVVVPWTSGAAGDQDPLYRIKPDFGGRIPYVESLGQILGEEVIRVAHAVPTSPRGRIRALQTVVSCPGRRCTTGTRWLPEGGYEFVDTDPVAVRLSVLMINHIALCGVSGEVLTRIGERLKRESPFAETLMITHANGSSGYLPDAKSYEAISYEIMVARVKPACENILIDGLLALLGRF